jgi:hypothetical protein
VAHDRNRIIIISSIDKVHCSRERGAGIINPESALLLRLKLNAPLERPICAM